MFWVANYQFRVCGGVLAIPTQTTVLCTEKISLLAFSLDCESKRSRVDNEWLTQTEILASEGAAVFKFQVPFIFVVALKRQLTPATVRKL